MNAGELDVRDVAAAASIGQNSNRCRQRPSLADISGLLFAQQISRIDLQHLGDLLDSFQARIVTAALERTDIGSIKVSLIGKSLLRQLRRFSCGSKIPCKTLPYVHRTYNSQLQSILHGVYSTFSLMPPVRLPFPPRRQR